MTDEQIIERESRISFQQCWINRKVAIDAAKTMRRAGMTRRYRRERRLAHNCSILARRWLNHGAWPYWHHQDTRAVVARKSTEELWIVLARHVERMRAAIT